MCLVGVYRDAYLVELTEVKELEPAVNVGVDEGAPGAAGGSFHAVVQDLV